MPNAYTSFTASRQFEASLELQEVNTMRGRLAAFAIGRAAGRNDTVSEEPQRSAPSDSQMDDLENLVSLHEKGALTDEEFKAAKKKLLGK